MPGPQRAAACPAAHEAEYSAGARASAMFGLWALRAQNGASWRYIPPNYANDFLESIVLHESGHNWGLQHNFIASQLYSPKELQSLSFTSTPRYRQYRHGIHTDKRLAQG